MTRHTLVMREDLKRYEVLTQVQKGFVTLRQGRRFMEQVTDSEAFDKESHYRRRVGIDLLERRDTYW